MPEPRAERPVGSAGAAAPAEPEAGAALARPRWLIWLPATALLLGCLLFASPPMQRLKLALDDAALQFLPPPDQPAQAVVVDIDDASLTALKPRLGDWPYRREVYALLIDYLREAKVRVIALDIVFDASRPGDEVLAHAVARRADVVLAAAGLTHAAPDAELVRPLLDSASLQADVPLRATPWLGFMLPNAELLAARPVPGAVAVVSAPLDADGLLRRLPLWHQAQGRLLPSLPLAALLADESLRAASGGTTDGADPATTWQRLDKRWPQDPDGTVRLHWPAAAGAPRTLPFNVLMSEVLGLSHDEGVRAALRDRVVFVGSGAFNAGRVNTPVGSRSGVAAMAQGFDALAHDRVLRPADWRAHAVLLAVALAPSTLVWRRGRARWAVDGWATGAALMAILAAVLAALRWGHWQLDALPALTVLLFALLLTAALHWRMLAVANRRLAYERAVADAANRAKSEFLAHVSHEIRTPMNALLGMAEMLAQTPLTSEQSRFVSVFRLSGQRLFSLINELLDLSQIESGATELHLSDFSLPDWLAEQVQLFAPQAEARGLALTADCPADCGLGMRADRERLAQVLVNLIGNALKFTRQGEVRISVRRSGALLHLAVSDSGVGIAPGQQALIFEPFRQADSGLPEGHAGTGLGLAIARQLVRRMGGKIWVESVPGQGSTFHFTLQAPEVPLLPLLPPAASPLPAANAGHTPAMDLSARPLADPSAAQGARAAPCHILLAEDDEVNVMVVEAMLRLAGHTLDVATDGRQAVQKFRQGRYDLVLMDIHMPVQDGLSATREIRALEASEQRRRTPILALTAEAFADDARRSFEAGCDAHLSKPVAQTDLLAAIRRHHQPLAAPVRPVD